MQDDAIAVAGAKRDGRAGRFGSTRRRESPRPGYGAGGARRALGAGASAIDTSPIEAANAMERASGSLTNSVTPDALVSAMPATGRSRRLGGSPVRRAGHRDDLRAGCATTVACPGDPGPAAIDGSKVARTSTTASTGGWNPSFTTTCTTLRPIGTTPLMPETRWRAPTTSSRSSGQRRSGRSRRKDRAARRSTRWSTDGERRADRRRRASSRAAGRGAASTTATSVPRSWARRCNAPRSPVTTRAVASMTMSAAAHASSTRGERRMDPLPHRATPRPDLRTQVAFRTGGGEGEAREVA